MNRFLSTGARRVAGGRQARWASSAAPQQSNSGLMMFVAGGVFSAGAMFLVGSGDDFQNAQQQKKISDLQAALKKQEAGGSGQQRVLKDLSEEYLQCTKGSEQLTGEMEEMAIRLKNTQEQVMASQKTMDLVTKENARYLEALTDRIQQQAENSNASSVAFVTEKGELVQFKLAGSNIDVSISGQSAGTLSKTISYNDASGAIKLPKTTVEIPKDRREILVTNLSSLADRAGMSHNLVGNVVEFTDAEGDRVKFSNSTGKLTIEMKGGVIAPLSALNFDKTTRGLNCGDVGSCTLPAESQESITRRLKKLAEQVNHPTNL